MIFNNILYDQRLHRTSLRLVLIPLPNCSLDVENIKKASDCVGH